MGCCHTCTVLQLDDLGGVHYHWPRFFLIGWMVNCQVFILHQDPVACHNLLWERRVIIYRWCEGFAPKYTLIPQLTAREPLTCSWHSRPYPIVQVPAVCTCCGAFSSGPHWKLAVYQNDLVTYSISKSTGVLQNEEYFANRHQCPRHYTCSGKERLEAWRSFHTRRNLLILCRP